MFVHRSNRLAQLVDQLTESLGPKLPGILDPEIVLIQSAGMERYLSRELSRRNGIVANVHFPFPRAFMRDVLDKALGADERSLLFERENLTWAIFQALPTQIEVGGAPFEPIRKYLEGDGDHLRRLLLAEKLAHFFDQYVTYRPLMVLGWQKGEESDNLQAILWRALVERWGDAHFATRCHRFMNELSDSEVRAALPARLSLLGGPGLPLLFLQMLSRMGQVIPTRLFSFSVCQEYFADGAMAPHFQLDVEQANADELQSTGLHPLLISLGKVGADFQQLLEVVGGYEEDTSHFFVPSCESLLTGLQKTLLEGRCTLSEEERKTVEDNQATDTSLSIDSCHSPLREVEVLHDRLLKWFSADPTLRPEDVVVLAPNIEEYSPLVTAVFSAQGKNSAKIPYRIADRSEKFTNAASRAFLAGLALLRSRFKVSDVLDLFGQEPVRCNYAVTQEELCRITFWVVNAGVRWGVDGEHQQEYGLPDNEAHTWRFGLKRLLLGSALFDEGEQIIGGAVPLDEVAPSDLELLGRFCNFCEAFFALRKRLKVAGEGGLSAEQWAVFFDDLAKAVLAESTDGAWNTEAVRTTLFEQKEAMQKVSTLAEGEETCRLGLFAMEHLLHGALDERRPSTDFLAGGVTFCSLLPLRTIPFRGVCVLGLNQGKFPRSDPQHQLDLIAPSPQVGDRSLRADDRYLFLEVLLSAQERICLSYVGRSVQDNTEKPPSAVVAELRAVVDDLLGPGDSLEKGEAKSSLKEVQHPLQPYDPSYFDPKVPSLSSLDQRAFVGARALCAQPASKQPFFFDWSESPPLAAAATDGRIVSEGEPLEISLEEVISFWKNPSAAFLKARGVRVDDQVDALEDREPVVETGLSKFIVGSRILGQVLRGQAPRQDVELARGSLPVGQGGAVLLSSLEKTAQQIYRVSQPFSEATLSEPLGFCHQVPQKSGTLTEYVGRAAIGRPLTLIGHIDQRYDSVRVETSFGKINAARSISMWIRHLAFCSEVASAQQSILVLQAPAKAPGVVDILSFRAISPGLARERLGQFARLAHEGLTTPLRFFPEASRVFFDKLTQEKSRVPEEERVADALRRARDVLSRQDNFSTPDPSVFELYRARDPLGQGEEGARAPRDDAELSELPFARLASFVFYPMAEATMETKR